MAGEASGTVQAPNQLATIQALLSLMGGGGQRQTTNPGDISALQQLMAQLQGADYQRVLESVFQQAAGNIPGLQAAYSNAVGARSGSNSAVAAALQELLKATTIQAQNQLVSQQLSNQQIQQNAAANIAEATRGTQAQTRPITMTGSPMGDLAALMAVMKGAQVLTGSKDMNDMLDKITGTSRAQTATAPAPVTTATVQPVQSAPVQIQSAPMPAMAPAMSSPDIFSQPGMGSYDWTGGVALDPMFSNFSDMFASQANQVAATQNIDPMDALMQVTSGFGTMPAPSFNPGRITEWFSY